MRFARAVAAMVGGAAIAVGAHLPWMSFYVGLLPLRGTRGLHGKVLFACGIVLVVAGIALAVRPDRRVRIAAGALGMSCTVYALYLLVRMHMAVAHIAAHDPMMLARRGPGLFFVVAGGLVAALAFPGPRSVLELRGSRESEEAYREVVAVNAHEPLPSDHAGVIDRRRPGVVA
jgi:hypothetical protein